MAVVAEKLKKYNIHALLMIGGFEVRCQITSLSNKSHNLFFFFYSPFEILMFDLSRLLNKCCTVKIQTLLPYEMLAFFLSQKNFVKVLQKLMLGFINFMAWTFMMSGPLDEKFQRDQWRFHGFTTRSVLPLITTLTSSSSKFYFTSLYKYKNIHLTRYSKYKFMYIKNVNTLKHFESKIKMITAFGWVCSCCERTIIGHFATSIEEKKRRGKCVLFWRILFIILSAGVHECDPDARSSQAIPRAVYPSGRDPGNCQ